MRARILAFAQGLRERGVDVSVAETLDALEGVAVLGVERDPLRETLAAALVKDERVRAIFDVWFDQAFPLVGAAASDDRRQRRRAATRGEGSGPPRRGSGSGAAGLRREEPHEPTAMRRAEERPEEPREGSRGDAGVQARASRGAPTRREAALRERPFAEFTPRDVEEARVLVEALARKLRARLARRERRRRRGRMDMRRTLRAAASMGGVPMRLAFRGRRPRRPELVALCDVSGSVAVASELCLGLLAPAAGWFGRVELFAYVDRPVPVSIEAGHVAPDGPLDLHARSDFGCVLGEFWRSHAPCLGRSTAVVILGDARNNRLPPRVDLLRRLRDRVQRLVWLVPEPQVRWNTGDSVLGLYAPFCDAVVECTDLMALERAVRRLFV